ncbi:DUF5119 domain-containing protein [Bacteroides xylanisolvens]|nr:DUF5119 domain-containing protein [Bacteroides xylanisolvens]
MDDKEQKYGATAVFYPRNGGEPKIFMMGDRSGDAVRLPMGVYDIIVFNRSFNDFSNIAFRGNSYETLGSIRPQSGDACGQKDTCGNTHNHFLTR